MRISDWSSDVCSSDLLDEQMQASGSSQRLSDRLNLILFIVNFAGSLTIAALAILALRLVRRNSRDLLSAHAALEQSAGRLALANRALEQANTNLEKRVAERTADLSEANEEIQDRKSTRLNSSH